MRKKPNIFAEAIAVGFLFLILLLLLPFLILFILLPNQINRYRLMKRVKQEWLPRRKCCLFVYSNSPNWKEYIETNILPKIDKYSVTLNWSERSQWDIKNKPLEVSLFQFYAEARPYFVEGKWKWGASADAYNPLAVIFSPDGKSKVLKFWEPFKKFKHGKEAPLRQVEKELFEALAQAKEI